MIEKIVVATKNKGKISEIKEILSDLPVKIVSIEEEGIEIDIVEDGKTFKENALKKAHAVKNFTASIVIADDSGLEVDYLNGAPGIYSSRFAGEIATDEQNNKKLISMMKGVEESKRSARFVCVIAVVTQDNSYFTVTGECRGAIALKPSGQNGFGYDPLFFIPEYNATMANLDADIKNSISHRAHALKNMKEKLKTYFKETY